MSDVWLVTGITGAGKTTAARLLATRMERAAHIEGDWLQRCIAHHGVWPETEPRDESERQATLNVHHQCLLARSFSEAGFVPVLDYPVFRKQRIDEYLERLSGLDLHVAVLAPSLDVVRQRDRERLAEHGHIHHPSPRLARLMESELRDVGLLLDTSALTVKATVDEILRRKVEAQV